VGKENTSTVSFTALSDEHYIIQLFQKMINISGETPNSKHINTDLIKAVTSGDWVTGRDLYKHPMKFRPFAKHYLAMNKVPNILDNSHGMWRRIWMIEFPRTFSEAEMDRDLESKLARELSGIFNWALEGYKRLRGKDFRLTESRSMKQSKDDYRDQMDSVRQFANDCLAKSQSYDDKLPLKDLYQMYLEYCQKDRNKDFEKKNGFKKVLEGMGYKIENSKKDGNQVYVFKVKVLDSNL
jgi:putative DNA primase/helicase